MFLAGAALCLLRGCEIDKALRQSALQVRFAEASCFMLGTNMELTIQLESQILIEKLQLMSHGAIGFGARTRCWLKLPDRDHWDDNHPMF